MKRAERLSDERVDQILTNLTAREIEILESSFDQDGTDWGKSTAASALVELGLLEQNPQAQTFYRITIEGEQVVRALKRAQR